MISFIVLTTTAGNPLAAACTSGSGETNNFWGSDIYLTKSMPMTNSNDNLFGENNCT